MIYKIIIIYLITIVATIFLQIDFYFYIFIFLTTIFFSLIKYFKGHIKDIMDMRNILLLFVFFLTSLLTYIYTNNIFQNLSLQNFSGNIYEMEGKIVNSSLHGETKIITILIDKIENLSEKNSINKGSFYIEAIVSPFKKFELYDRALIIGEITTKNFSVYHDKRPLFFSYEFEKLIYDSNYIVSNPKNINILESKKSIFENIYIQFHHASNSIKNKLDNHMQEPFASIASGITFGEQDNLQKEIKDIFRTSGLIHILVLSGANISFIISILWFLISKIKLKINNGLKVFAALFLSWIFIFGTGLTAPSIRAGIMSSTNILAEYFIRNISGTQSLLISLFILTLINPISLIYSPSLHLSFLACFGLFVIAPIIYNFLSRKIYKNKFLNFTISTMIGIFISTIPYILALTEQASLFGVILTILIEPIIFIVTILSFLIVITSFINIYLANILGILNTFFVSIIYQVAKFGAENLPNINLHINIYILIFYYLILLVGVLFVNYKNEKSINYEKN